jgi:hypothetical protein
MKIDSAWDMFGNSLGCVRLVLLVDWDPIGIFGIPEAMDEYDTYAGKIHNMLGAGASQDDLVAYLRFVQSELMGVGSNPDMSLIAVAAKLRSVFDTASAE